MIFIQIFCNHLKFHFTFSSNFFLSNGHLKKFHPYITAALPFISFNLIKNLIFFYRITPHFSLTNIKYYYKERVPRLKCNRMYIICIVYIVGAKFVHIRSVQSTIFIIVVFIFEQCCRLFC